jgi:metallo-beta-lactamase family protein
MGKIDFLGAAGGEVTGSCYLVTAYDGNQALVDFGMFQGNEEIEKHNYDPLGFRPADIQAVFLTHGHFDHCGRLPLLVYGGFRGKIFMTAPTREFVEIILNDSAKIAEKDRIENPLYTANEVSKVLRFIELVEYNSEVKMGSFRAVFRDAGHILGSSSIELTDISSAEKTRFVFSGDLGNTPQSVVRPTQYIDSADFVVMESTYGDSSHPDEDPEKVIQDEINTIEKTRGVLLIPAFAIERTQEILHIIHHLKKDGKVAADTPVFLDSPMGIDATMVYVNNKKFFNDEMLAHDTIPFNFEELVITDDYRDSRAIFKEPNPKVIIAGSGMMSGGRILHHAVNYLSHDLTRLLFVGYQAEETLGREILRGAKRVIIEKMPVRVDAHVREIKSLSSHADQPRLLKWLSHIKGVKRVFLTHGEKRQQSVLAEKIREELGIGDVVIPGYQEGWEVIKYAVA